MGLDYRNHHVICGRAPDRARLLADVQAVLMNLGYTPTFDYDEAARSLAFAITGSWIAILGSSDNESHPPELQPFRDLAVAISADYPVVSIEVSDSAIVELTLLHGGRVLDRFANGRPPFYMFTSDVDAAPFRGAPDLWRSVFGLSSTDELAAAFDQSLSVAYILERLSTALGWNFDLATCGFLVSYDGIPAFYEEHLDLNIHKDLDFKEQHYRRAQSPA